MHSTIQVKNLQSQKKYLPLYCKFDVMELRYGVMVAPQTLILSVWVRIPIPQQLWFEYGKA